MIKESRTGSRLEVAAPWTSAGYRQTELAVRRKSTGILRCSSL